MNCRCSFRVCHNDRLDPANACLALAILCGLDRQFSIIPVDTYPAETGLRLGYHLFNMLKVHDA